MIRLDDAAQVLVAQLPRIRYVVWLRDPALLSRAAHVAHVARGSGLATADAISLTSLMDAGAEEICTTDSHLEAYPGGPRVVRV